MTAAVVFKAVEQMMPAQFDHIRVDVRPVGIFGSDDIAGHTVGIMNTYRGQGTRTSLEHAEAEAKAVLKAIRSYRRKNRTLVAADAAEEDGVDG